MTWTPARRKLPSNSRGGGNAAARRSKSARGTVLRAASISSRLDATISSRIVVTKPPCRHCISSTTIASFRPFERHARVGQREISSRRLGGWNRTLRRDLLPLLEAEPEARFAHPAPPAISLGALERHGTAAGAVHLFGIAASSASAA